MEIESTGSSLPLASLRLLVPPVRLMSAFMWKVIQQLNVPQFDKLLDFVVLATEAVPELLSAGQRARLLLGLRAKVVLELCRDEGGANVQTIRSHLDEIHACSVELSSSDQAAGADILKTSYTNFASLVEKLLNVPFEKEYFFQEVFPANYGSSYDERLQQMVSEFLSRLEQLLPVPDLQQTAGWLTEDASLAEEVGPNLSEASALNALLLHHRRLGTLGDAPSSTNEEILLATCAGKMAAAYGEDERYGDGVERLVFEDLEEDLSQSSGVAADELLPKKDSGSMSAFFVCPRCPFAHRLKKKVQDHIQKEHQKPSRREEPPKTGEKVPERRQAQGKKRERKQKKDNLENKVRRRRKGPAGEDKRFLSARRVSKNFPEEENKCPTCEKVFEHPNQLRTHAKLHTFPYSCGQCEKGFTSPSGYYQHQRLHKRGRVFTCGLCDKGFLCNYSLRQHERLHDGPSNLCAVCGKSFSKAGITRHMQMHRGEKNYLCTTCGKSFLSSGELLLHTRSHTGETPYTCGRCGKGFSSKSHLNVHTRSHTGERPYLCAECPKRFLTLNCLKRHALSHNGVKPFKCPSCSREFSQQGNLKRHLATHKADA